MRRSVFTSPVSAPFEVIWSWSADKECEERRPERNEEKPSGCSGVQNTTEHVRKFWDGSEDDTSEFDLIVSGQQAVIDKRN